MTSKYVIFVDQTQPATQPASQSFIMQRRPKIRPKMATNDEENVFASPWNGSDMVLVVEDQELHVHKWILTMQSPVFKAMFDGHFKEASQDKITLKEKSCRLMVQFLKVLYPSSMFVEDKTSVNDESRLSIMPLAEEYQCVNLIKQFINEIQVTPENVLKILPYVKYHQAALSKVCDVIKRSTPTSQLKEVLPELESKEASSIIKILLTKCDFLESGIVQMQDAMISLIRDFRGQKRKADDTNNSFKAVKYTRKGSSVFAHEIDCSFSRDSETVTDSRCHHTIDIRQINKAKSCVHCKETYKEKFIAPIPSCQNEAQNFFDMLEKGDEVATAVKNDKNSLPQCAIGSKKQKIYGFVPSFSFGNLGHN